MEYDILTIRLQRPRHLHHPLLNLHHRHRRWQRPENQQAALGPSPAGTLHPGDW